MRELGFDAKRFAQDVQTIYRQRGTTLDGMCRDIGIDPSTMSKIKNRGREPRAATAAALVKWSGLDITQYMLWYGEKA